MDPGGGHRRSVTDVCPVLLTVGSLASLPPTAAGANLEAGRLVPTSGGSSHADEPGPPAMESDRPGPADQPPPDTKENDLGRSSGDPRKPDDPGKVGEPGSDHRPPDGDRGAVGGNDGQGTAEDASERGNDGGDRPDPGSASDGASVGNREPIGRARSSRIGIVGQAGPATPRSGGAGHPDRIEHFPTEDWRGEGLRGQLSGMTTAERRWRDLRWRGGR